VPGSVELIEALYARGVPLYALTNFSADFWPPFRAAQPIFDRFRDIVVSGTEKLHKPDPAIYALAAERFGHAPSRMLFIDDNADNVAAAVPVAGRRTTLPMRRNWPRTCADEASSPDTKRPPREGAGAWPGQGGG
jgi:2-haloacid dehalogenase